jgi:hypothetical protein
MQPPSIAQPPAASRRLWFRSGREAGAQAVDAQATDAQAIDSQAIDSQAMGTSRPLYFVNGWLDLAVIGGLSIAVFAVARIFFGGPASREIGQAAAVLSVFVNYPHFSATLYRLYENPDNVRRFPLTAIALPVLLIGAIAASLAWPDLVAPYFILLFVLWSPYHYSGQTVGITMIYARRAGIPIGRPQRTALSIFVFATFVASLTSRRGGPRELYGFTLPAIPLPDWFAAAVTTAMWGAGAVFLWFIIQWCRDNRRLPPPIMLLPPVAQYVWFMPGSGSGLFYELVPLFHSLQYLYIAWAMQVGSRVGQEGRDRSWRSIRTETTRWALWNYFGGMALFIGLPWLFFWVSVPMVTVTGIVIAAVNIQHFFVDGVIWKLRSPSVSSPLMMNIVDLSAPARPVAA